MVEDGFEILDGLNTCVVTAVSCFFFQPSDLNYAAEIVAYWMIKESTDDTWLRLLAGLGMHAVCSRGARKLLYTSWNMQDSIELDA